MANLDTISRFSKQLDALILKASSTGKFKHNEKFVISELSRLSGILNDDMDGGGSVGIESVRQTIGVSRPILTKWRGDGFPESINRAVPSLQVIKYFYDRWVECRDTMVEGDSPGLERKRMADAEIAEMKLAVLKEELVDYNEIERVYVKTIYTWEQIQRMVDRLPSVLHGKTAKQIRARLVSEFDRVGKKIVDKLKGIENN